MLRAIISLLEGLFFWSARPRILILIVLFLVIGGVTWIFFDVPTVGIALKKFVLKTLPQWYTIGSKTLIRLWPKVSREIANGAAKKYGRKFVILVSILVLSSEQIERLKNLKNYLSENFKDRIVEPPIQWWKGLSKPKRIIVFGCIIAVIVSIPALHTLGMIIMPLVIIKEIALFVWRFVITKLGVNVIVENIHTKISVGFARLIPTKHLICLKWMYLRGLVVLRAATKNLKKKVVKLNKKRSNQGSKTQLVKIEAETSE